MKSNLEKSQNVEERFENPEKIQKQRKLKIFHDRNFS